MIVDRSFAGLIGFAKAAEKPQRSNWAGSMCEIPALKAMIGVSWKDGMDRSVDATLHPSSFGICKSRITRSG